MTTPAPPRPRLTDRETLLRHRARGRVLRGTERPFLHDEARAELQERLLEVNRTFTAPAVVTGHSELWSDLVPGATVVPDDEVLNLQPGAHDLVIHALCLHWADDPVGQLIQSRRALRPDGLFLGVCFGGETLAELRAALAAAEAQVRGGLSPRVLPLGDLRDLGALLQRAGLALPVADQSRLTVHYTGFSRLVTDLRAMGETNALAARDPKPIPRRMLNDAVERYAAHHPGPDGTLRATFDLVYLTGWSPSPDQPKSLRPGSATVRLADALGTVERDPAAPDDEGGAA